MATKMLNDGDKIVFMVAEAAKETLVLLELAKELCTGRQRCKDGEEMSSSEHKAKLGQGKQVAQQILNIMKS